MKCTRCGGNKKGVYVVDQPKDLFGHIIGHYEPCPECRARQAREAKVAFLSMNRPVLRKRVKRKKRIKP